MRLLGIAGLLAALGACGAEHTHNRGATLASLPAACNQDRYWNGKTCVARPAIEPQLKRAIKAVAAFQVDEAIELLGTLRKQTPHRYDTLVKINEQLGIAQAYRKHEREALRVFDTLLALAPGHLLSYHLSPQVTFVYERARKAARKRQPPTLHVTWPRGLETTTPVPVDVSVVADPKGFLQRAAIWVRKKGDKQFKRVEVKLPATGAYRRVVLPALGATKPETLQLYLTAFDDRGNEVLRWSSAERPREIALDYRKPARWYRKWWVWAIAGGVVAAGTGTAVYLIGREPPDTIGGGLDITR